MAKRARKPEEERAKVTRPAITPEARESQLISLAENLAEEQLRAGTASSQVIVHYLKLGSSKEHLEKELMEERKALMQAKTEAIKATEKLEEMFNAAIDAMRVYNPND